MRIFTVFPAHAGMIPQAARHSQRHSSVPRACGDDPYLIATNDYDFECSPRMRG